MSKIKIPETSKGAFGRVLLCEKDGKEFALKETLSRSRTAMKTAEAEAKLLKVIKIWNV